METPGLVKFYDKRQLPAGNYRVSVTHYLNITISADSFVDESALASKTLLAGHIGYFAITPES